MPDFNLSDLTRGHVLPVLPAAALQLQSKQSRPEQVKSDVGIGNTVHAGDADLSTAPILFNEQQVEALRYSQFGTPQIMPLEIRVDGESDWWLLPIETLITVTGSKIMTRRSVAKSKYRGTIKESWALDDYRISVVGMFRGENQYKYPEQDVKKLRNICEATKVLFVRCPLFQIFNINQMVLETYDFGFTKGEDMQAFTINGYSDDQFQLFIELD